MTKSKIKRYPWALYYLIFASCLIGFSFVYVINLPFLLLASWSPKAWEVAGKMNKFGLGILRQSQPWWRGELNVKLPPEVLRYEKGCLCVANHRSHMDVFLLLEQIAGIRVLTKHLIFLIPGLGGAALLFRMIYIKRGKETSFWRAMDKVEKALKENSRVHIFPEMTRCQFGETQLSRFTLAPFQKALAAGVPILPIVIWGTDFLWPKGVYRIALKGPLVVKSLPAVDSTKFTSASELSDYVKKQIQDEVIRLNQTHSYESFS